MVLPFFLGHWGGFISSILFLTLGKGLFFLRDVSKCGVFFVGFFLFACSLVIAKTKIQRIKYVYLSVIIIADCFLTRVCVID